MTKQTRHNERNNKKKKMDQFGVLAPKISVSLQAAFAVETQQPSGSARGASEHGEVGNIPNRDPMADCIEDRGNV